MNIKTLNYNINNILSSSLSKSVLIEIYNDDYELMTDLAAAAEESKQSLFKESSKRFIDSLYSKLKFKTSLQVNYSFQR